MKEVPIGDKDNPKTPPIKGKGKTMPYADEQQEVEKKADAKKDNKKDEKKGDMKDDKKEAAAAITRWDIKVPTNAELAVNLKGKLLLVHGDMDNNVHPGGTMRLVDALMKANKRFDMLIIPGKAHGFGAYQAYFNQRMWAYFAEHLLDDRPSGADLFERP
jgi:hypothetical protein